MNRLFKFRYGRFGCLANSRSSRGGRNASCRAGVAMLEFAIVLPVLLLLVLGIIEMGRVMMLNQVGTNACREACRRAIIPGAQHDNIVSIVNGYLDSAGVSQNGRLVSILNQSGSPVNLANVRSHFPVTVQVEVPYVNNTWGFTRIMGQRSMVCRATMRRE